MSASATIHHLAKLRRSKPVEMPESWNRVAEIFGFPQPKAWVAFELWGRGRTSYVMLVADSRLRVNISLDRDFASRAEARAWALAYTAGLGRELPEQPKRLRRAA
jgi:hypothetical protein